MGILGAKLPQRLGIALWRYLQHSKPPARLQRLGDNV